MIPASKSEITSNIDQLESKEFTMLVGEKAFSILVDSLYTDKVLAAVRELSTNAVDAHVMAGKQSQPFKVVLPTYLENTFSVRDYGCSMDHHTIMNLYSKLFWSPKDTTNTQVGYLGLGSKSPLAYTDSFSVIAYLDGIRRDYLVGLNQERIPTITKVNESDTLEPDGLEVSFPVKMGDSRLFELAAEKVFMGLDVQPECNIDIISPEIRLEFENWKVLSDEQQNGYGKNKFFIKQGCVLYPFEFTDQINSNNYSNDLLKRYTNSIIVVDVPIGSVEVATSREALSMDEKTTSFVDQLSRELSLSVERYLNEQLAKQKNSIDAAIFLYTKVQPIFDESYLKRLQLKYNGKTVERYIRFTLTVPMHYLSNGKTWVTKKELALDVNHIPKTKFIIQSAGQKVQRRKARLKQYIKEQSKGTEVYFLDGPRNKDISRLLRFYILPENIIPVESIPDTEYTSTGNKSVAKTGAYVYNQDTDHHELIDNMEDDFLWVPITRKNGEFTVCKRMYRVQANSGRKFSSYSYNDLTNVIQQLDITNKPIYHLNPMMQKRLGVSESNRLDTIMTNWVNDNIDNIKVAYFKQAFNDQEHVKQSIQIEMGTYDYSEWISNKPIRSLSSFMTRHFFLPILSKDGYGWDQEVEDMRITFKEKYPMLHNPTYEQRAEYIKMINQIATSTTTESGK